MVRHIVRNEVDLVKPGEGAAEGVGGGRRWNRRNRSRKGRNLGEEVEEEGMMKTMKRRGIGIKCAKAGGRRGRLISGRPRVERLKCGRKKGG